MYVPVVSLLSVLLVALVGEGEGRLETMDAGSSLQVRGFKFP